MCDPIYEYQFRFILIGDSTVGKSSLLRYFTDGKFEDIRDPTVGVDFYARLLELTPGVRVKLQLWDTAGQERFRSITKSYYRSSVGVIIVYDITKRSSFENIETWYEEAREHTESSNAIFVVLGQKADDEDKRQVTFREGKRFAEMRGLKFFETSAKTGQNVEKLFIEVAKDAYQHLQERHNNLDEMQNGVKAGFARPKETVHLAEAKAERQCC